MSTTARTRWPHFQANTTALRLYTFTTLVVGATATIVVPAAHAQPLPGQQASGPVIQSTGMSYKVENPTFRVPANNVQKVVYEIAAGGGDSVKVNEQLTTVARFYNLSVRNGLSESQIKTAAVFHGAGWTALLTDSAFAARYNGAKNPSKKLVEELLQHGAIWYSVVKPPVHAVSSVRSCYRVFKWLFPR